MAYGYLLYSCLELLDIAGDDADVGALFGELDGYGFAHAFGATGKEDGLYITSLAVIPLLEDGRGTLPSTGNWFLLWKRPILSATRIDTKTNSRADAQANPMAIERW